ncbi:hypothetical protein L2735_05410 [Shewanella olleyana]|uniref:hypothetical protein n=1 Tax=Shewanella olleyana TaxID=135626 RepID=UPI00200D52CA|nr:hypothetical protein [Shewanella olleyana]MCL1066245.1 hypothetical protein [Shewanella olleyana]
MSIAFLFCRQGRDNGLRALAIQLSCLVFVLIIALLFSNTVVTLIAAAIALPVCGLSSLRRVKDAAKPNSLIAAPLTLLLIFSLSLSLSFPAVVSSIVFILAALVSAAFAWLPAPKTNQRKMTYVMGYNGPHVKSDSVSGQARRRREPTMGETGHGNLNSGSLDAGFDDEQAYDQDFEPGYQQETVYKEESDTASDFGDSGQGYSAQNHDDTESAYASDDKPSYRVDRGALESGSLSELLKSWLIWAQSNQKALMMVAKGLGVVLAISLVIYLISLLFSGDEVEQEPVEIAPIAQPETINETARVKLPDGFWLILQQDVLVLRWLGDEGDAQPIWRLDTAEGDNRCAEMIFNDGSKFRPMQVDLMADSGTEARFSPLDNKRIIDSIAMRGSFKLCGYNFSLKGSQATLSSQPAFEKYLKGL